MFYLEQLSNISLEELKCGYTEDRDYYICLFCGEKVEKGVIYPVEEKLFEDRKYIDFHIQKEHGSVFEYLINLDKKITGLSEHQSKLLKMFYDGQSDEYIQRELGIGSNSTIRNHRFILREKERQAKMFLILMELLKESDKKPAKSKLHSNTVVPVNDIYNINPEDIGKILDKYLPQGVFGKLKTFNIKEKSKFIVLREITKLFESDRVYNEKEVNEILENVHEDYAAIRRYMIDFGFMKRKADGSEYWLKIDNNERSGTDMDRKKELKQEYKEIKTDGGVFQIKNIKNQKIYIDSTSNFKTLNGKRMQLRNGSGFINKELQEDWKKYGEDSFEFEILEVLKEKEEGYFDKKEELKKLEKKWLDKLKPYGDKGYNKEKDR